MPTNVEILQELYLSNKPRPRSNSWNTEGISGYMTLMGPDGRRQNIQVKVYRTIAEHFAVIYPQKKICHPLGVINLRGTMVSRRDSESFVLRLKDRDNPFALTFFVENKKELDFWILVFTVRSSPPLHQSSLPIVEEEDI